MGKAYTLIVSLLIVALFPASCTKATPESQLNEIGELLSKKYEMTQEQKRDITALTDARLFVSPEHRRLVTDHLSLLTGHCATP